MTADHIVLRICTAYDRGHYETTENPFPECSLEAEAWNLGRETLQRNQALPPIRSDREVPEEVVA